MFTEGLLVLLVGLDGNIGVERTCNESPGMRRRGNAIAMRQDTSADTHTHTQCSA